MSCAQVLHIWIETWCSFNPKRQPNFPSGWGAGGGTSTSVTDPTGSMFCNIISISVTLDRSCITDWAGRTAPSMRCMSSSQSDGLGIALGGDPAGVSNNCLMTSSNVSDSVDTTGDWVSSATWKIARGNFGSGPPFQLFATSIWLSHTQQLSTMSRMEASEEAPSRCRRNSQLCWAAMNLFGIIKSRTRLPMSSNLRTARIPNSVANIAGSTPGRRLALSNRRRTTANLHSIGLSIALSLLPVLTGPHSMPPRLGVQTVLEPPSPVTIRLTSQWPGRSRGAVASNPYHQTWEQLC